MIDIEKNFKYISLGLTALFCLTVYLLVLFCVDYMIVIPAVIILTILYIVLVHFKIIPDGVFFKYDKNNKEHRALRWTVIVFASLFCFVMVWWLIAIFANSVAVPTPLETWAELVKLMKYGDPTVSTHPTMWAYMGSSLKTFLLGFLIAFVIAVPIGLFLGYSKNCREFATPIIEVLRPIAPIAWAPILILSINYTLGPILVVTIGIFFPLLTNTIFGVTKLDPKLIDAARTLGANKKQLFINVLVPSALPYVMNGVKIGLGIGWMCIIAAELYAPSLGGIGGFLSTQAYNGYWPDVYAALIMIAALGLLTTTAADYAHKFLQKRMGLI